eukprot:GHVT01049091.1.p3 GENE.GHVT01049091.1~~GHVT01049091.1.p3  ORF type:complete len:125 (+),score=18.56 GHVT01049091.1:3-377(+)
MVRSESCTTLMLSPDHNGAPPGSPPISLGKALPVFRVSGGVPPAPVLTSVGPSNPVPATPAGASLSAPVAFSGASLSAPGVPSSVASDSSSPSNSVSAPFIFFHHRHLPEPTGQVHRAEVLASS